MDKVVIRVATTNDARAIRIVSKEAWVYTYPNEEYGITRDDLIARFTFSSREEEEKHTRDRQKVISEDHNQHYWVAETDNKIVGFCLAKKEAQTNVLQALHVLPGYQRLGIGKQLLTTALRWLGNEKQVKLNVVIYNKRAITFYEKFGFNLTGKKVEENMTILPSGRETPNVEMVLLHK